MKYTKNHTAYYNKNKSEVPSVTTILKILSKPALIGWANYLGFKRQKVVDVLNDSSNLGTTVHGLITSYILKKYVIYIQTSDSADKRTIYLCLNNFLEWYKKNSVEPIFMEQSMSTEDFGGTVDFYGKVNDLYTIVDFKTSKKIRLSMFLQLALYTILLESHNYTIEQVGIVLVGPKNSDNKFIFRKEFNIRVPLISNDKL